MRHPYGFSSSFVFSHDMVAWLRTLLVECLPRNQWGAHIEFKHWAWQKGFKFNVSADSTYGQDYRCSAKRHFVKGRGTSSSIDQTGYLQLLYFSSCDQLTSLYGTSWWTLIWKCINVLLLRVREADWHICHEFSSGIFQWAGIQHSFISKSN